MSGEVKIMGENYLISPVKLLELIDRKEDIFATVKNLKIADNTRIFLIGSGSSGEGLQAASFLWEQLLAIKPYVIAPYQFNHYPTTLGENDIVLALSQTGTSHEVVEALRIANSQGATSIGISTISGSPILQIAKIAILVPEGKENCDYKIVGVVVNMLAAMLVGYGIALANALKTSLDVDILELQAICSRYFDNGNLVTQWVKNNFKEINEASGFTVVGSGPLQEAAEELAIKLIEVTNKQTMQLDIEEYMHGGCAVLDPKHILIMIVDQDSYDFAYKAYNACINFGKRVIWLGVEGPQEGISLLMSDNRLLAIFDGMNIAHSFVIAFGRYGDYGAEGTKIFAYYQDALKVRE